MLINLTANKKNTSVVMDTLSFYIITWNVAAQLPEDEVERELEKFLGLNPQNKDRVPDFYVIGLQEVSSQPLHYFQDTLFTDPWTNAFRAVLSHYGFAKVKTLRLMGMVMSVFCIKKLVPHLRDMECQYVRTGLMGLWGNKGAMGFRFDIQGCSFCFVNCHLTAHEEYNNYRIHDYTSILKQLKFNNKESSEIMFHDYIFWFGDLNFRFDDKDGLNFNSIVKLINDKDYDKLLKYDQLVKVIESNEAFSELQEAPPDFPPTFKFIKNSSLYDPKRRPAWTDRILYRVNKNNYENIILEVKQLMYTSGSNSMNSDHRPVMSRFDLKVFSNHVDRQVTFYPITLWRLDVENTAVCKIPSDWQHNVSCSDWVGVYESEFTSLEDYVTYIYVTPNNRRDNSGCSSAHCSSDSSTDQTVHGQEMCGHRHY
ncbi:inositol polyphosphate 5-phosphatase K-like isoform X2 [Lycorma delicatula]|uniref:inositol polyphosphate 5-phosphatase K-like isoform X2 n=1 Tax=Lycorma delicatula TaxID=130591 RepID=UPI003F513ACD